MADGSIPSTLTELGKIDAFVNSPTFFQRLLEELYEGVYFVDTHRRILYWNRAAHRISGYSAEEVIGHYCQDNILNHVDDAGTQLCFGKCPLLTTIEHGVPHECEIYLHHKNGHRVPVRVHVTPVRDANNQIIGAVEMFVEANSSKARNQRAELLHSRGFLDPLTDIGNRRYLEIELFKALQEFRQHGLPFGAILADIDHLRIVNEHYGHTVGDQVLRAVSLTLANAVSEADILGRWSVDEFLILVPSSSVDSLGDIAERCRALVERANIQVGTEQLVATISAGASAVDPLDTMEMFIRRLENYLQRSKYSGRNRITMK
ncbi:diguanylate cyclase with PAS/PAC sensor [Candidatus Koribacter versatilis Ellin345]|uniref:Diguanylate cyclase with PAS/PAC sensor n=1 Tax=Koribacter versatilis (strain Ellin345) TaxID=204669 RepID=Q1IQ89_KORVE|nr:GGDEF domain-containing protein [Candidatus Koribacter versatilis]ABF40961.1 diguanylate cyclase with PAS/PAC sensor [Candidatus Koribacter versatilis Ellin345]